MKFSMKNVASALTTKRILFLITLPGICDVKNQYVMLKIAILYKQIMSGHAVNIYVMCRTKIYDVILKIMLCGKQLCYVSRH